MSKNLNPASPHIQNFSSNAVELYRAKLSAHRSFLMNSPRFPTRPVRPMRWTYSSMSLGRSKLMTCFTLQISRPRAATCDVATVISITAVQHNRQAFTKHSGYTHSCCNHNGATSRAELVKRLLSIPLRAVTVDAGASIALPIQKVL